MFLSPTCTPSRVDPLLVGVVAGEFPSIMFGAIRRKFSTLFQLVVDAMAHSTHPSVACSQDIRVDVIGGVGVSLGTVGFLGIPISDMPGGQLRQVFSRRYWDQVIGVDAGGILANVVQLLAGGYVTVGKDPHCAIGKSRGRTTQVKSPVTTLPTCSPDPASRRGVNDHTSLQVAENVCYFGWHSTDKYTPLSVVAPSVIIGGK